MYQGPVQQLTFCWLAGCGEAGVELVFATRTGAAGRGKPATRGLALALAPIQVVNVLVGDLAAF